MNRSTPFREIMETVKTLRNYKYTRTGSVKCRVL